MKKISMCVMMALLSTGVLVYAKEKKKIGYQEITILDHGVKRKRKIQIPSEEETMKATSESTTKSTLGESARQGVIVAFKKEPDAAALASFAFRYGLQLKKRLVTGYYIFKNVSDTDDSVIISRIIKNEKGIDTVKPNWKKSNRPR
jgi:hypothetical protein